MGIGDFFKALFGGQPPGAAQKSRLEAEVEIDHATGSRGKGAASRRAVAVITLEETVRERLDRGLKPVVEAEGYRYEGRPSLDTATGARILIMEALPDTDARLHTKYDKIVRVKKSMGKTHDVVSVIGLRGHYKKYPRGTYPGLLFFCINPQDPDFRATDIEPGGMPTVEGPTLYNFADIAPVIRGKIREQSAAKTVVRK